jgi:5'(3')-deoxyribonucleotidase
MKRIAVDMDEVLADALGELIRRYNAEFNERLTVQDMWGNWMVNVLPASRQDRLSAYLQEDDFFEDLKVMPDSQRVVERLSQHCEIFIATAAMEFPKSFGPKYRWLRRHFPFLSPTHFVFCGDKSILHADYLIDDMPRHFERFTGQGVLFTAAHNAKVAAKLRVNNWLEVEELFFPRSG